MSEELKHLVLIDPTQDRQIALERAIITSRMRDKSPRLHLFIGVDQESTDLKPTNKQLYRDQEWMTSLTAPLEEENIRFSYELCWSDDWQEAVLISSERFKPSHIFMPDNEQGRKRLFFSTQQWAILRKAKVPVTICRPKTSGPRRKMLAAVNIQKEDDPRYASLNEKILKEGIEIAKIYGAEFYVVNAYSDSLHYPDREKLMKRTGLPTTHVHVEQGDPVEVIVGYANKIGADTVVIGTMARSGALGIMKGNTSEKVLRRLQQDVITYSR